MKKILVIILIALLTLTVAAELYVQSDLFAAKLRLIVIGPLQEVLGERAQIGWIRANFIPMYIEARDIVLPDDQGRPAVAVRKVRVSINPLPLLFKKVRLPSIMVLEPRITVVRSWNSEINILPLVSRIRANIERLSARGSSGYTVLLKNVSVNQGTVNFKDESSGAELTLKGLQSVVKVNLAGDSYTLSVRQGDLRVQTPAYPALTGGLKATVRYEHGLLQIDDFDISAGDTAFTVAGSVGNILNPVLDLRVKVRSGPLTITRLLNLFRKDRKERQPRFEANATIRGKTTAPVIEGRLQASGILYRGIELREGAVSIDFREHQLRLHGEQSKIATAGKVITVERMDAAAVLSAHQIDITRLDLAAGDLTLGLSGRADPLRGFDARIIAESRYKGRLLSMLTGIPVEGDVRVKGTLTGTAQQPLFDGTLAAGPVRVRGILFDSAAGRVQYQSGSFRLASIDIHQQAGRFIFNASADLSRKVPLFDARLKVIRADIRSTVALFYEPLPLFFSVSGELLFTGTTKTFSGTGKLSLDPGSAYGEAFSRGVVTASLTKERITFPQVSIDKGSGSLSGTGWIGFDGTYAASLRSSKVRLSEVGLLAGMPLGGAFDLNVESSGSFSRPEVRSTLVMDELLVDKTGLGGFSADLRIADKVLTCRARLEDDHAVLSGRMTLHAPYPWSLQGAATADSADPFLFLGARDLPGRVRTSFTAAVNAHGNALDKSSLNAFIQFRRLAVQIGDYGLASDGAPAVSVRGDRFTLTSFTLTGQGTRMALAGGARFGKEVDLTLSGSANLSLLRPLLKDLEYSNGTADLKLSITDEWKAPEFSGELTVRNGELKVKDIPQKFSSLNGRVLFDQSRVVVDSLTGEFGGGTLKASGKAQFAGIILQDFSTRMNFENVTVRYPEGLTSTLSGDLFYDGDKAEQSLTGDVLIKRARYDKRVEWKSMLVDIGRGFTQRKKTEAGWVGETQINVRFSGKENILFQNNLAKVPLEVDVFLRGTVNRPQLLGRVEARKGSVFFRQNEFKILHASADFVDPNRVNPVLDIQAEIQVREYLVRLAVSGTADHAVVTLLSDPSLPDSDILALLALGKTGSELKGKEAGVGMSEAASFATGRFQDIFESRARSLTGLDRFQVDPYVSKGDTSVPRVTVGKEIVQDKLYVTYSSNVGSTTPEQIFRIEYVLNKHFSLVGERNELGNTGADIKYRFEFK